MRYFFVFWVCMLIGRISAKAQNFDEVVAQYPGENAVMLSSVRDLKIFLKDNKPFVETMESKEIMALTDKANGFYNKYKIYYGSFEDIYDVEAFTKVPDGNRYKKVKVTNILTQSSTSNSVFYDDTKEMVFDFPSLIKGAIATVSHKELLKESHLMIPFYFSSYLPVINSKCTLTFPEGFDVKYIIRNDEGNIIQVNKLRKGRQNIYEFTASHQKPKDYYRDAPPRSHYEPHVIFYIASYTNDQGNVVPFLANVDDLYNWNYNFLKDINNTPSPIIKHLADSLVQGITTDKEKAKQIYKWVQEHIKYVAFENGLEGFVPRQADAVCTKRYGDCKDMSSLLTALLKQAGLKAYFTWIGTRDIPYQYNEVHLPIADNHMICTVNIDNEWIFLDGTDPNCIFGVPSKAIQGKQAMVSIGEKDFKIITVPVLTADKNVIIDSTFISFNDHGIQGNSSVYYKGYFGVDAYNHLLYRNADDTKDYVKALLLKGSNKYILDDYSINPVNPNEKIINFKSRFQVPDYGKKIADELYINLNLSPSKYNLNSLIDTTKRKIAIDNDFRFQSKNYIIFDVPKGFEVSYMPESYQYKNELFSFAINYNMDGNKIIASQDFKSDCMMLQPKDFDKWNDTVNEAIKQYKKQLVLKKK